MSLDVGVQAEVATILVRYVHVCVCVCMHACVHACVCACVCVCVCIHMCVYRYEVLLYAGIGEDS